MTTNYSDLIARLRERGSKSIDGILRGPALEAATALESLQAERDRMREALEPFSAMGRVMETRARVTFGKIPKDSEIVCESSGEAGMGILTMGHFRDAAALLPGAPGWGGVYKPLRPLSQEDAPNA